MLLCFKSFRIESNAEQYTLHEIVHVIMWYVCILLIIKLIYFDMNVCFFEKKQHDILTNGDSFLLQEEGECKSVSNLGWRTPAGFVNSDTAWKLIFLPHANEVQGLYRNHFVCPSVCADSCPAHNFLWFDIG